MKKISIEQQIKESFQPFAEMARSNKEEFSIKQIEIIMACMVRWGYKFHGIKCKANRQSRLRILKRTPRALRVVYLELFKFWLRNIFFRIARKSAQLRANSENYKIYVIRDSELNYKLLSTTDVDYNKRVRILGKNATAKELEKLSSYVAYPKRRC